MSSKKDKIALRNKVIKGLEKAFVKLVEVKKQRNEDLVILKDDKIIRLKPR